MMRIALPILCVALLCAAPAQAVNLYDDFENGVGGDIVYAPWGNVSGDPTSPNGINNLIVTSSDHSVSGTNSARANASDPAAWNGYTDFGATAGFVRAEVWVFEDFNNDGTNPNQPVTNMLSLYGDSGTNNPNAFTDYLQLGVVPFYPSGSTGYGTRSRANGVDLFSDTGVDRAAGWTKLAIEADGLADGGAVRYYINDALVGASVRSTGVDLRWVRLGNNSPSYENFWYDDLRVTPEPASVLLLGMGSFALVAYATGRRRTAKA